VRAEAGDRFIEVRFVLFNQDGYDAFGSELGHE
jgi:hypothetical protein